MSIQFSRLIVLAMPALLAACAFVQTQPGSEKVVQFEPSQVTRCTQLGTVKVSVLDRAGLITRDPAKVARELQQLARNSAVDMGGDTIVPAGPASAGAQQFNIYRCQR